jgi:hypothetical protein
MTESKSQLLQDIFALTTAQNKTYIEVGAAWPEKSNNTYVLEKNGWEGFSIELDIDKFNLWQDEPKIRKNKIYCEDAITFNYLEALKENNLPTHIGYLSIDIEPPENTFNALKKIINQGITFDCITFEHDNYQSDIDYNSIATEYLKSEGYKVAVENVYMIEKIRVEGIKKKVVKKSFLETWYVSSYINFSKTDYDIWKSYFL